MSLRILYGSCQVVATALVGFVNYQDAHVTVRPRSGEHIGLSAVSSAIAKPGQETGCGDPIANAVEADRHGSLKVMAPRWSITPREGSGIPRLSTLLRAQISMISDPPVTRYSPRISCLIWSLNGNHRRHAVLIKPHRPLSS